MWIIEYIFDTDILNILNSVILSVFAVPRIYWQVDVYVTLPPKIWLC